jgi:DNA-binding MarR family transcriptional regulator
MKDPKHPTALPEPSSAERADDFRSRLEAAKRESTLQVLFKVARLLDETALERIAARHAGQRLRRSHTSLFPHIALEGTRITELADRLGITKQAVSKLVDDLEAVGVLTREPDPEDARARRVQFTKRGKEGFFEGLTVLRGLEQELAGWVGNKRMKQLRTTLLTIQDRLARPDIT